MSKLPKLAIVGRPNVGKSSLFNKICKKRMAIVDEAEGVTRDRIYAETDLFGLRFEVIDTGGIDPRSHALFNEEVKRQAEIAIEEADTIVMVVDGTVGPLSLDKEVAEILHRTKKPLCLAINKIDSSKQELLSHQFYGLGITKMIPVSAIQNSGITELLEAAFEGFSKTEGAEENSDQIKVAIIGRPNVGKSTLVNHLLDEERCAVSPIAGTTRDSIDVKYKHGDKEYTLIDTAGIRRKKAEHEVVDKFAAIRTQRAIDRADICVLLLDIHEGLTMQDKRILATVEEAGKGCILLFNKWDTVKGFRMEHCLQALHQEAPFTSICPTLFISAKTGRNLDKIFDEVERVFKETQKRISTGELNRFVVNAMQRVHPPMLNGKRLRIYYMTQVDSAPPRFILFVNYPELMVDSYKRYLLNQFRETYSFAGVPILLSLKGKIREPKEKRGMINKELTPGLIRQQDLLAAQAAADAAEEEEEGDLD